MKKRILVGGLCALLLSGSVVAQSSDELMLGGKAGFAKPHGSRTDSGVNIAGVLGKRIQPNIFWEES